MSSTVSEPGSSAVLRERIALSIGSDLAAVNQILDQQLQSPHQLMGDVLNHAGEFRGKQIRPVLLLLCQKVFGRRPDTYGHTLAAVVEMIHTATLVHDDVLDNASRRRSLPTINQRWNTETSVLLGDYLFSRAFRLAASTGDAVACEMIGRATDLTCAGELHQIEASRNPRSSERDYFRVIRGKTGQLFGLSCHLGARAAQAAPSAQRQVRIAGLELGMAFQIADDLLDLTGEEDQIGKDVGNDLENDRMTLPLLRALQSASAVEQQQIRELLNSGTSDSLQMQQKFESILQGISSAEQTASQFVNSCLARLQRMPATPERELLEAIASFAIRRRT